MNIHTFKATERRRFLCWMDSKRADSLLFLAFATRWNPKNPSYIRIFSDKWSKLLCINYDRLKFLVK